MLQYPPRAELHLQVGDCLLPLWQLGIDACILREPAALPAGEAAILVTVDGRRYSYPVVLPEGSDGRSLSVRFAQPPRWQFTLRTVLFVMTALAMSLVNLQIAFLALVAAVYSFLLLILGIAAWRLARPEDAPAGRPRAPQPPRRAAMHPAHFFELPRAQ